MVFFSDKTLIIDLYEKCLTPVVVCPQQLHMQKGEHVSDDLSLL